MKQLLAAFALIAALPAAAAAQSAPVEHAQHDGKDCCDHKTVDGKPMVCCEPDQDGKRPACCDGEQGEAARS